MPTQGNNDVCEEGSSPPWACEAHPDYDAHLTVASRELFNWLAGATPSQRRSFALDPRDAHRALYAPLTPPGFEEYAGSYRGVTGTSLEGRYVNALSHTGRSVQGFQIPSLVQSDMENAYARRIEAFFDKSSAMSRNEALRAATLIFYALGRIHPFLDGNGHIQRLVFAACIMQTAALDLAPKWAIHPRPYGYEFADAFEGRENAEILKLLERLLSSYVVAV